jgi:hypothetical protein
MSNRRCWVLAAATAALIAAQPASASCEPDLNDDGVVDVMDLLQVLADWGACPGCPADFDGSGAVDVVDLLILLDAWGECLDVIPVELAGNALSEYPYFEYVTAFNEGTLIRAAIDPNRYPDIVDRTGDVYLVAAKTYEQWTDDPALIDVTGDGPQTESFVAGSVLDNLVTISGSASLSGDAGTDLGVPYDLVFDMNQNGVLDGGDYIDGLTDPEAIVPTHGLYIVHDVTQPGPLAVTIVLRNALPGTVTPGFEAEKIYYPSAIGLLGELPLIVVSHGNGHNYQWYDHIGNHMASYGYVVMSHANNTVPGVYSASTTTLEHTDAFLSQLPDIAEGVLVGHVDSSRIIWLGHSRGGEGVAIAVDRIFDGDWTPEQYTLDDLILVSSIAPVDFLTGSQTDPHGVNYHLWTGGADDDVNGCAECNLCQTFHLHDRATDYRQSISLYGVGHGDFHDGGGSSVASGPCLVGRANTHLIMKGYFLPLVKHYAENNVPAKDFLWRQWERFRPIGAPTDPCVVVDLMYRDGRGPGYFVIDDYQSEFSPSVSSSGGPVTFTVENLTESRLDDENLSFTNSGTDEVNGMTVGGDGDQTRGVVFQWDNEDRFYELGLTGDARDVTPFTYLTFRACQATRHPLTTQQLGDLTFTVTLRDGDGVTSSINIGAYGGGIEEPYQRSSCGIGLGWANEFETIRIRLTDFLRNGTGLDLTDIDAVRFEFGPAFGSAFGRIGLEGVALSDDGPPPPAGRLRISAEGEFPDLIAPGEAVTVSVRISGEIEEVVPGTEMLHYRFDDGSFQAIALELVADNLYEATLPAPQCGDEPEFYFSAEGTVTGVVTLPLGAPGDSFRANVGIETAIFDEPMDDNPDWTISGGQWAFGQPTGQGGGWGGGGPDPTEGFSGPFVYGYNLNGNYTNNLPEWHLTTPPIDCSEFDNVTLSFMRWLCVETSIYDHAYIRVSTNGSTWTTIWQNSAEVADTDWREEQFDITDLAAGQSTVYIRWTMGTTDGSWIYCGWNIDDVRITSISCE